MKTRIETSGGKGVISGEAMKPGDFGVIVGGRGGNDLLGHLVYCHDHSGILDLNDPTGRWERGTTITVRLIADGETIKITRTE